MEGKRELMDYLFQVVGEEGCGLSCENAEIFQDQEGWKMRLCGFMEPWTLGKTVDEAKGRIREYASQGFGLGSSS